MSPGGECGPPTPHRAGWRYKRTHTKHPGHDSRKPGRRGYNPTLNPSGGPLRVITRCSYTSRLLANVSRRAGSESFCTVFAVTPSLVLLQLLYFAGFCWFCHHCIHDIHDSFPTCPSPTGCRVVGGQSPSVGRKGGREGQRVIAAEGTQARGSHLWG